MGIHGSWEYFAVVAGLCWYAVVFEKLDQGKIVVFIEAAPDFVAVFSVAGGKRFDRSAMGDIALSVSAHEQLCSRAPGFFQDETLAGNGIFA